MNETLTLKRRLHFERVIPELLVTLQRHLTLWPNLLSTRWDWMSSLALLLALAMFISALYLLFTRQFGLFAFFVLGFLGSDLHDNALPIFARVRIRGDKLTTGKLLGERHSLADVRRYSTSQQDLPPHLIRFDLSEKYWPNRISLVIDKEDAATLRAHLEARGIDDVAAVSEPVALEI